MKKHLRKKDVKKVENEYFELLKLSKEKDLSNEENDKFITLMNERVSFLEEEFVTAKENVINSRIFMGINGGLWLVDNLKTGINITSDNPIQGNFEQFAAHFDSVIKYENSFIEFRSNMTDENFFKMFDYLTEAEGYVDGYTKKKTLSYKA